MMRADQVADSLIRAGMPEAVVRSVAARLRGEQPSGGTTATTAGTGAPGSQERHWVERPAEGPVIAPRRPEVQDRTPQVWQAFRVAGVPGVPATVVYRDRGLVGAGAYTVSITLAGRAYSTRLEVVSSPN